MENENTPDAEQSVETAVQNVVGVRFKSCGKIYTFRADDLDVMPGSRVVVDSEMGVSLGTVVTPKRALEKPDDGLKKVLRVATDQDFETIEGNTGLQDEARAFCVEKAGELHLPMKIVSTETTMDKKRLIFYFTADGRIDFRELVRDLAARFKTRIEMRQIGVRDEVKLLGGIGACGRQTCCNLFLTSFEPITIRMAKQQELTINQSKLSGICGRLMCCLGYEYRDSSEQAAPKEQENELVTVTDETPDTELRPADSEALIAEVSGNAKGLVKETRQGGEREQPVPETGAPAQEQRRHGRRNRRRRRSGRGDRQSASQQAQPAQSALKDQQQPKTEGQEKGRAFSRRKRFWKKKKN